MSEFVSVIFCRKCTSRWVEISEWSSDGKAVFHCRTCGAREEIENFTMGRCRVTNSEHMNARETVPKKGDYEK